MFAADGPSILIWSNAPDGGEHLAGFLGERGYATRCTANTMTALQEVREAAVSVVLLEACAVGDEVLRLCQALKEGTSAPRVVALLGSPADRLRLEALAQPLRPDHVLLRPVPTAQVLYVLERYLWAGSTVGPLPEAAPSTALMLLLDHWQRRSTGRLEVEQHGVQIYIYLRQGVPVFAEHGTLGESLGRLLVTEGTISQKDLARAIDHMTDRLVDNEQMRLGEALIELQILSPEHVFEAIRKQVQQKIFSCLSWSQYSHFFRAGDEFVDGVGRFECVMERLVLKAVQRHFSPSDLERVLEPHIDQPARLRGSLEHTAAQFGFKTSVRAFLGQLDGRRSVRRLRDGARLDVIVASQILAALVLTDHLVLGAPAHDPEGPGGRGEAPLATRPADGFPPPARSEPGRAAAAPAREVIDRYVRTTGKGDHQVLRLKAGASPKEIQQAYLTHTRELQAVAAQLKGQPDLRGRVKELMSQLRQARDRLTHGRPRTGEYEAIPPDEKQRKLEAEKAYQEGLALLQSKREAEAAAAFGRAQALQPQEKEFQLYTFWLGYWAAVAPKEKKRLGEDAQRIAQEIYRMRPDHPLAHLVLGHFLTTQRKFERAQRHLMLAAQASPALTGIQQALGQLEQARRATRKGGAR